MQRQRWPEAAPQAEAETGRIWRPHQEEAAPSEEEGFEVMKGTDGEFDEGFEAMNGADFEFGKSHARCMPILREVFVPC